MPVTDFLHKTVSQFADKAQDALNKTPLGRGGGSGGGEQGGPSKNNPLGQLQHQFRSLQIQYGYGSASPVQRLITTEKSLALDLEAFKRDAQGQSKELYMWGQGESSDLKDITDRLAWLNYITGSLANTVSDKLNAARGPLKALRDHEASLAPRRNARATLQLQIDRLEQSKEKGYEKRIVELRSQLRKAEEDDAPEEREIEIAKRKAIRESETLKFEALREFGEKLSLIAQASVPVLEVLPSIPPSPSEPYTGAEKSGNIRAMLQHALDNWGPGDATLRAPADSLLDRRHTRSFGETHATELSQISTDQPHGSSGMPSPAIPGASPPPGPQPKTYSPTPPPASSVASTLPTVQEKEGTEAASPVTMPVPVPAPISASKPSINASSPVPAPASPPFKLSTKSPLSAGASPPINPNALNNSPAPIPQTTSPPSGIVSPDPAQPDLKVPSVTPTVAETGVPIQAKAQDPGPASGSLKDLHSAAPSGGDAAAVDTAGASTSAVPSGPTPPKLETAEEEKRRLESEHSSGSGGPQAEASSTPKYESAEDEKKRLEREERERILRGGEQQPPRRDTKDGGEGDGDEATPPPYQEF